MTSCKNDSCNPRAELKIKDIPPVCKIREGETYTIEWKGIGTNPSTKYRLMYRKLTKNENSKFLATEVSESGSLSFTVDDRVETGPYGKANFGSFGACYVPPAFN